MTPRPATALITDLYELMMAAAYVDGDLHQRPATFSLFVRQLPPGRGYLVAGGLAEVLAGLRQLRFGSSELDLLAGLDLFDDTFLEVLAGLRFDATVRAVPEGRIVFADEPLIEITGPMITAQLVETFVLNQVTTQTTLATKAARLRDAAQGRAVVDFSLRRTQGIDAGMKVARAAAIIGLAGTSNVAAASYGVPLTGTMAHSFVQAHRSELEAFRRFADRFGDRTTLLIDTYDTMAGLERAIELARELRHRGQALRAVRIDSGDLAVLATTARRRLDAAGFPAVQVVVSGGLDETAIADLVDRAPDAIAGFGVGSALGVSSDAPVLDSAYKLVAFDGRPVRKTSVGKASWPGPKQVWRRADARSDVLATEAEAGPGAGAAPLLVTVLDRGEPTDDTPPLDERAALAAANGRFELDRGRLPDDVARIVDPAGYPVEVSQELLALTEGVDAALALAGRADHGQLP